MSFRPQSERKPFANNMAEISTKAIMAFEETLNTADLAKTTSAASDFTDSLRQRITSQLSDEEPESQTCNEPLSESSEPQKKYRIEIVWKNVFKFIVLHCIAFAGLLELTNASSYTLFFTLFTFWISSQGITAGAHRLWTHRSYKAKLPLRIFLVLANAMAGQDSVITWSRDHRVHHKYSETDADPHNAKRGFFFSHMGWLLCRKHPEVIEKGSKIDISDLTSDPVLKFQHRFYAPLSISISFLLPSVLPAYFWGESVYVAYCIAVLRYAIVLHATWMVNSVAHLWGSKPYDVHINPAENLIVSLLSTGEGFHNYHHTFPHDYSTSEWRYSFNMTTLFIDCMAFIGQVYDRRSVSKAAVQGRIQRTGPQSESKHEEEFKMEY